MTALEIDRLARTPASEVKKQGWRGVMRSLAQAPAGLLVTNHDQPEAVILSKEIYQQLFAAFRREQQQQEAALEQLRREFDQRLSVLDAPGANDKLRAAAAATVDLGGSVRVGHSR